MQKRRLRKNNIATISEDLPREEVSLPGRSNQAAHQVTAAQLGRKFSLASSRSLPQTSLPGCYKLVTTAVRDTRTSSEQWAADPSASTWS